MEFFTIEVPGASPAAYELYAVAPIQADINRTATLELNQGFVEDLQASVPDAVILELNQVLSDWKLDMAGDLPTVPVTASSYTAIRNLIQGGELAVYRVAFEYRRKVSYFQVSKVSYNDADNVTQTVTTMAETPYKTYQAILAAGKGTTNVVSAGFFDGGLAIAYLPKMAEEAAIANNVADVNWVDDGMQSTFTLGVEVFTQAERFDAYSLDNLNDKAESLVFVLTETLSVRDDDDIRTPLERGTTDIIGYQK